MASKRGSHENHRVRRAGGGAELLPELELSDHEAQCVGRAQREGRGRVYNLQPNGTITLTIDESNGNAKWSAKDIVFNSGEFLMDTDRHITGGPQGFNVRMSGDLEFDPKTGLISGGGGGTWVEALPSVGGCGWLEAGFSVLNTSRLEDSNSNQGGFNLANGLGCKGKLTFNACLVDPFRSNPYPRYPDEPDLGPLMPCYYLHIDAAVSMEDVDGDGTFEVKCKV